MRSVLHLDFCWWCLSLSLSLFLSLYLCLPLSFADRPLVDWSLYYKTDALLSSVEQISASHPHLITSHTCPLPSVPSSPPLDGLSSSPPHDDVKYYTLTSTHVKHSDSGALKLRMLLNFGEHGRELISSEIAFTLMRFFDSSMRKDESAHTRDKASTRRAQGSEVYEYDRYDEETSEENDFSDELLAFIARNTEIIVVPLLNAWGRRQVESGYSCSRKNSRGVDLNRNWDYLFEKNTFKVSDETWQGEHAFSEAESRCLRDIAIRIQPHVYVNVHSGIQEMYHGWDHSSHPIPNVKEVSRLLEHLNQYHCACKTGGAGKIGGYVVFGGSMDWMYAHVNATYSLTYEVFGGKAVITPTNCFAYFNPTDVDTAIDIKHRFASSFLSQALYMIEEKLALPFPFRLPSFLSHPLFMPPNKEERLRVKLYYHPWNSFKQIFITRFQHLLLSDPHSLLSAQETTTRTTKKLRVLMVADSQFNHHVTSEILYHLHHQLVDQHYAQRVQFVLVPTLFPVLRSEAIALGSCNSNSLVKDRAALEFQDSITELQLLAEVLQPHLVLEFVVQEGVATENSNMDLPWFKLQLLPTKPVAPVRYQESLDFDNNLQNKLNGSLQVLEATSDQVSELRRLNTLSHMRLSLMVGPGDQPERISKDERFPPSYYRRNEQDNIVICDWPRYNPSVLMLQEFLPSAMLQLHDLLKTLSLVQHKATTSSFDPLLEQSTTRAHKQLLPTFLQESWYINLSLFFGVWILFVLFIIYAITIRIVHIVRERRRLHKAAIAV